MKRSDEVAFVRECGKYEKMCKADFYEMLGVNEICICQDNFEIDELNEIHRDIKLTDLYDEDFTEFVSNIGVESYLNQVLRDIEADGCWEAFNDGYNSITYSSLRFLNYRGIVFASEVFDEDCFSRADTSLFNHICENQISGIKDIYIKNWS